MAELYPFQPTRPLRGATGGFIGLEMAENHFNPRAPCGARLLDGIHVENHKHFNPRAPCGARRYPRPFFQRRCDFNPRAPCGARHLCSIVSESFLFPFQPTRPLRGATRDLL